MDAQETPPDVQALVAEAKAVRLAYALGREPDETPDALQAKRRSVMGGTLRGQKDPADGSALSIGQVWASFEPDERGLLEVLVTSSGSPAPYTVFVKGTQIAYVCEGW